jgi:hypothetical protein
LFCAALWGLQTDCKQTISFSFPHPKLRGPCQTTVFFESSVLCVQIISSEGNKYTEFVQAPYFGYCFNVRWLSELHFDSFRTNEDDSWRKPCGCCDCVEHLVGATCVTRLSVMVQTVNKLRECHSAVQFQLQNSSYQFLLYNFSLRCEPFQAQLHLCVCICLCLSVYRLLLLAQRCLYSAAVRSTGQQLDSCKFSHNSQDCTNHLTHKFTRFSMPVNAPVDFRLPLDHAECL